MSFPVRWKEVLKKHMAAVPSGSSFPRYKEAVKAASREYRGHKATASNPPKKNEIVTGIVVLGAGYAGYSLYKKKKAADAAKAAAAARAAQGYSAPNMGIPGAGF